MKRRLRIVCVFLLLGAIINVAVAWGIAWYPIKFTGVPLKEDRWQREENSVWRQVALPSWPEAAVVKRHKLGYEYWEEPGAILIAYERLLPGTDLPEASSLMMTVTWQDYGWPALSMRAIEWSECPGDRLHETIVKRAYIPFDRPADDARLDGWLPTRPIWRGFAINTVFYALMLWLLFAAPFALRRRRRIKRGLCPKCAYDLRGSASQTCPECGASLARKVETSTSPNVQRNDSTIDP